MDPAGMNALREAAAKRMGGPKGKGLGPGGSNRPNLPHELAGGADGGASFNPPNGMDGLGGIPSAEGLGLPTPPPSMDPPLTSRDFASLAGPSLAIYAFLTFIPTILIFQLIYGYYFQEQYFGGLNFYKLMYYALTGQLAKRMGLGDAMALADAAKANQAKSNVPLGKNGKPLTPAEEYANISAKAKLVSAVLRSRRHEYHGLTDDEYMRSCVAEATSIATGGQVGSRKGVAAREKEASAASANGKSRVKVSSGMLSFLNEEEAALRSNPRSDCSEVKCENLAIFIGVNTDETPLALDDAEKLCNRVFKDPQRPTGANGTYRTCFFGCPGDSATAGNDSTVSNQQRVFVKPSSANLMALIVDIATCRVRQWNNIVVYVAAPVRAAPVGWLDDALVRDESTNFIHRPNFLRSDLVTAINDKDSYYLKHCFTETVAGKKEAAKEPSTPFPKFTLEYLADVSDPASELSWVDINLFVTRLREAVLESARLQEVSAMVSKGMVAEANNVSAARFRTTGTNIVLMLDVAYRPEGVYESVHFITNQNEAFFCDPTVGLSDSDKKNRAASESNLNEAQQNSLRLTIDVDEKHLFAPPEELLDTLASLSLHEAVAYGPIATLTPFTNFTVLVAPRRNYFVEKAVRQGIQKVAWGLEDGKHIVLKTPAAALNALMASGNAAAGAANRLGGLVSQAASLPNANNPRLIGFSDFVRCFMEGYFAAMAADGKVPTADVVVDKLNDPTSSLIAPGIRGSVENSAFWCGRMTIASTVLYMARHPQMMGFSDLVLPTSTNADGTSVNGPVMSSGMSMASTASPGSKVPTTATPLLGCFTRGVMNDVTLFSQMSLAPRGAPSAVCPPLLLMPSQKHLRHCEEVLVPAIRTSRDVSCFHIVTAEGGADAHCDLNPTLQAIGWNGELLRHFTDGIHFFNVPTLVGNLSKETVTAQAKVLSGGEPPLGPIDEDSYVDLLAQHFIMRLASSLIEHGGHSHFGTVPSFAEAIRVLTVFKEQSVMSLVFLNAPRADADPNATAIWLRSLVYLHDVLQGVEPKPNGEARIAIILVPAPISGSNNTSSTAPVPIALPSELSPLVTVVPLPFPSALEYKSAFRSKWVLPYASSVAGDCYTLHTNYTRTYGSGWPAVGFADTEGVPYVPIEGTGAEEVAAKRESIEAIVSTVTGRPSNSSPFNTVALVEDAAKALVPSSLNLSTDTTEQATSAGQLYETVPEGLIAPLLRYLALSQADESAGPLPDAATPADIIGAVARAILSPTAIARRVAPTTDATSTALVLKALYRTVMGGLQGHSSSPSIISSLEGVDGVIRIPSCVAFGMFDDLLAQWHADLATRGDASNTAKPQFARVWTLFHDTLTLLGFSGILTSCSSTNGASVSQHFVPYLYAATGTSATEAAAVLRSDSTDNRMYAALLEDLQPFIEFNPLVTLEILAAMAGEKPPSTAEDDEPNRIAGCFLGLTFRSANAQKDERLLFATIAGHRMRFSQTSLWTRYVATANASIELLECYALKPKSSTLPPATLFLLSQALSVLCFDVLDTLFVSNVTQLMPLVNVLSLLKRSTNVLEALTQTPTNPLFGQLTSSASNGTPLFKSSEVKAALRRSRGYMNVCAYACCALAEDGTRQLSAVMAPTSAEWWVQLAHTSELLDGNVGRPITSAHIALTDKKQAASKDGAALAIDEYKFDADEETKDGERKKTDVSDAPDVDPRLRDGACPIQPIIANRPSTAVAVTTEEMRKIISQERPPRVQFLQLFERPDLGGDEPNAIEELDSDADEDDVAELNARLANQEVRRRAAMEANQAGILLASDMPVTESGRCYYRGSQKDAVMLVATKGATSFPWSASSGALPSSSSSSASVVDSAVSCLTYVDDKLIVGHVDGRITVCEMDTGVVLSTTDSTVHQGAPVTDVIPYSRSHADMANHTYYLTYAAGVKSNGEDDAEAHVPEGPVSTCIVTASKSNRRIVLWPNNMPSDAAVKSGNIEALTVLDNNKSVRMKDPMSRCFFARLARRGVDEVQLRQNIGNPEELTNTRRKRDMLTLLTKSANKGRKGAADEPLDEDELALAASVTPILKKAKAHYGATDTVIIMYGASMHGTQHVAEERFNDNAFVGTDGVWQFTTSLTVPLGYEVTAATVGPGPKGEARVAVAVTSLTCPEKHYVQQFEIVRSR